MVQIGSQENMSWKCFPRPKQVHSAHCSYIQLRAWAQGQGTAEVLSISRHFMHGLHCWCTHESCPGLPNIWKPQVSGYIPFPCGDHLYTISMLAVILFPYLTNDWQEWGGQEELFIFIILFIFLIFTVFCITDAQDFCGTTGPTFPQEQHVLCLQ